MAREDSCYGWTYTSSTSLVFVSYVRFLWGFDQGFRRCVWGFTCSLQVLMYDSFPLLFVHGMFALLT